MDLAGGQIERNASERTHGPEGFADVAEPKNGAGHVFEPLVEHKDFGNSMHPFLPAIGNESRNGVVPLPVGAMSVSRPGAETLQPVNPSNTAALGRWLASSTALPCREL